jgi:hypothetical protein
MSDFKKMSVQELRKALKKHIKREDYFVCAKIHKIIEAKVKMGDQLGPLETPALQATESEAPAMQATASEAPALPVMTVTLSFYPLWCSDCGCQKVRGSYPTEEVKASGGCVC